MKAEEKRALGSSNSAKVKKNDVYRTMALTMALTLTMTLSMSMSDHDRDPDSAEKI